MERGTVRLRFFLENENMAIRPLHDRIVVKRVEAEEKRLQA